MDNLEARLQDLAQDAEQRMADRPLVPRSDVVRRGRVRRAGLFLGSAALVAVLAVGGYAGAGAFRGRSQLQPATGNVLTTAVETTLLEDTARTAFSMEIEYDMAGATSGHTFEGTGELSFIEDRSHIVSTLDGEGESELTHEIIQDGLVLYTRDSSKEGWTKEEVASSELNTFGGGQMRPEELLDYVSGIDSGVEIVGEEEIDGERVTHYVADVDLEKVLEDVSAEEREAFSTWDTSFEPVHTWIDDRGRVRRMSFVLGMAAENDGRPFDMAMSFDVSLFDFGEPVDIEVPDESEVVEGSSSDGFGISESETVTGEVTTGEGDSVAFAGAGGPYFSVHVYEGPEEICIGNVPEWAWKAGIYREGEDSPLFEFSSDDFDSWDVGPEDDTKAGCIFERVRGLSDLEANATDLIIRMESDSRTQDVPIVATERF